MNKILAGVPCGRMPICDAFYDCLYQLQMPEGSLIKRVKGGSLPFNRNILVQEAISNKCTHLFLMDDDIMFPPDMVLRLLHHDKVVVGGVCTQRFHPFKPYVWDSIKDGKLGFMEVNGQKGLIKVMAVGMAGILLKMEVFERIKFPWFQDMVDNQGVQWTDDIIFSKKLIEEGIDVYCDLDANMWHRVDGSVTYMDGKTILRVGDINVVVPSIVQEVT